MKNVTSDLGVNNLVGDGATDNLAHLNAAIAAWTAADGAWFWPAGTYVVTALPSTLRTNMRWYGEGPQLTVIKGTRAAPSSTAVFSLASTTSVRLEGMHITTTDDVNAAQQCLDVSGSTDAQFIDVKMSNAISGGIRAATKAQLLRYIRGEVTNIYQDTAASGFSGDLSNSIIDGTYFHDNATQNTSTRHCIYINGAANPVNTTIQNCIFKAWGGGAAISLKGDASGIATGSSYNLAVTGCTFDGTGSSNNCVSVQGVIGCSLTNNRMYMSATSNGFSFAGNNCWGFLVDGNTCTAPATEVEMNFCSINFQTNGSGKVTNNIVTKTNGYYDAGVGVSVNGSIAQLEISNNLFSGIYAGVLLTTSTAGNLQDVLIKDNNFNNAAGAVDVTSGGKYVALPTGLTAGVIVDGAVRQVRVLNNRVSNMNHELAFTTAVAATGSAGTAVNVEFYSTTPNPSPATQLMVYNSAHPARFTVDGQPATYAVTL